MVKNQVEVTVFNLKVLELKEYFTFTPNPPTITLNNNLDEKILAEEHEVILGLSATLDKVSVRSTVVIAIPDLPTAPNFNKVTYTGSYDKENLAVKLDDDLETDAKDPTSVEITVEDRKNQQFAELSLIFSLQLMFQILMLNTIVQPSVTLLKY